MIFFFFFEEKTNWSQWSSLSTWRFNWSKMNLKNIILYFEYFITKTKHLNSASHWNDRYLSGRKIRFNSKIESIIETIRTKTMWNRCFIWTIKSIERTNWTIRKRIYRFNIKYSKTTIGFYSSSSSDLIFLWILFLVN